MQAEIRAIAQRHDMAVMGPNCEGFANTAANLCPTFSPAMEAGPRPLLPAGAPRAASSPSSPRAAASALPSSTTAAPRSSPTATS